ncbi:MAG: hypothetical protein ACREUA_05305, partial [Burkholderiales bacterium]
MTEILRLYPEPSMQCALEGLYLAENLHRMGSSDRPFVYANFISSLDGRIALIDPGDGKSRVPGELTSLNDWRLFQELQAQADCFITHGAYLRTLAEGRLDDILQVGTKPESADLLAWRKG